MPFARVCPNRRDLWATSNFLGKEFRLQKGGSLPEALLGFKTWGTLSPARDNVIVSPTWFQR